MKFLEKNVGKLDRLARIGAGVALLRKGGKGKMGMLGLMPLMSGLTGRCPCYSLLGISTAGKKAVDDNHAAGCGNGCGCHGKTKNQAKNQAKANDEKTEAANA